MIGHFYSAYVYIMVLISQACESTLETQMPSGPLSDYPHSTVTVGLMFYKGIQHGEEHMKTAPFICITEMTTS